jgi:hypothetical protein
MLLKTTGSGDKIAAFSRLTPFSLIILSPRGDAIDIVSILIHKQIWSK